MAAYQTRGLMWLCCSCALHILYLCLNPLVWRAGLSSAPSQMLQHMAVPHPAAARCHTELQSSSWLRIATELGLNPDLTRILNFCGMVLLLLISYSKLSQSVTTSLQTTPEVLKAGLELTGAVEITKHSQDLGGNTELP